MGPFSVTGQPNPPDTNCLSMTDPARGLFRVAFVQDQKVVAALFIGPDPVALSRLHLAGLPGQAAVAGVLSGRPGGTMPDPGETICACFNVGLNTIRTAIAAQGLSDLAAIGVALQAGTDCGSCRVDLAALLAEPRRLEAAE